MADTDFTTTTLTYYSKGLSRFYRIRNTVYCLDNTFLF